MLIVLQVLKANFLIFVTSISIYLILGFTILEINYFNLIL